MKKTLSVLLFAAGAFVITLNSSCKKKEDTAKAELDAQVSQHNTDVNDYKSESDQVNSDINNDMGNHPSMARMSGGSGGGSPLTFLPCGTTIDTSQLISNKIIYYNFDGVTPCLSPSRTRSGQIKVQLTTGTSWATAGSVLTITYNNFKVTTLWNNKSITINGTKTLENVNGINWITFVQSTSKFLFRERALNIAVTFDGGQSATWNSARTTEWSYLKADSNNPSDRFQFTAAGDTTINGFSHVDSWGTNRYGYNFTTYYNAPIASNTYCGLWRPTAGTLVHNVNNANYTLTLGVDKSGAPTPYVCAYGFKVGWVDKNGVSQSLVITY